MFDCYSNDEDVYFHLEYAKLYEQIENGEAKEFLFENENGVIYYQYIKRLIPIRINDTDYYDIITPYGYGGPLLIRYKKGMQNQLINDFNNEFINDCKVNKIVSEFVRFHPIIKNYVDFKQIYNPIFLRNTIAIDLSKKDILMDEFSATCRNKVRKGIKSGIKIELDFNGKTINDFYNIYIKTMKKNNADDYYFFPLRYFEYSIKHLNNKIFIANALLDSKIISCTMFMYSRDIIHSHLGGTLPNYYNYSSNNVMLYEVAKWGKINGKKYIHLGGGFTNDKDDGIFRFKKHFTKDSVFDFYIGKRIFNQHIYDLLTFENMKNKDKVRNDFFPEYRA